MILYNLKARESDDETTLNTIFFKAIIFLLNFNYGQIYIYIYCSLNNSGSGERVSITQPHTHTHTHRNFISFSLYEKGRKP